jgi:N-methylhydantoinase B/oxoprolinase/acetone carboxylase alpha subunit
MTNTENTPIEALERAFPMRVLRYRLRAGAGEPANTEGATASSAISSCSKTPPCR